jgi:signal transduction histidine kinase
MGTVLDEFLNFSRPVDSLAVREVEPGRLIAEVASLHEGVAVERDIALKTETASSTSLRADPRKLKQVLVNLVQNALDATPRGGSVVLRARSDTASSTTFEVSDTGAGIDEEVRARLFRPGTTTKPEGSGLGLVIARSIAEQHGGTLELVDRAEGGCVAVFRVPTQDPSDEPAALDTRTEGEER